MASFIAEFHNIDNTHCNIFTFKILRSGEMMKKEILITILLFCIVLFSAFILFFLVEQNAILKEAHDYSLIPEQGDKAYLFEKISMKGKLISVGTNPVVLIFFNTSCGACKRKNQFWQNLYNTFGSHITFVGISSSPMNKTDEFINKYDLMFPIIWDKDGEILKKYKIKWFPLLVFINNGKIQFYQEYLQETSEACSLISRLILSQQNRTIHENIQ